MYNCTKLTALNGCNKTGALAIDDNGYTTVILGALDFDNSAGEVYPHEWAKPLFNDNSSFMAKVNDGYLSGELGHPQYLPGMTKEDFIIRIRTVLEANESHHIKKVWIERKDIYGNGRMIPCIMGLVRPSGAKGSILKDKMGNVDCNVAFSIRSLTQDTMINGKKHKRLVEIVTWDHVIQPGISVANKYQTAALENIAIPIDLRDIQNAERKLRSVGASLESVNSMESLINKVIVAQNSFGMGNGVPTSSAWV